MKLHTYMGPSLVASALAQAKRDGYVTGDVEMVVFDPEGSRSHHSAYEIQLGTYDKYSLPGGSTDRNGRKMRVRHFKSNGSDGPIWAATYDEWGWFMRQVFAWDPDALFGSRKYGYDGAEDFRQKTGGKFR